MGWGESSPATSVMRKLAQPQPLATGKTMLDMDLCSSFTMAVMQNLTSTKIILEEDRKELLKSLIMITDTVKLLKRSTTPNISKSDHSINKSIIIIETGDQIFQYLKMEIIL